MVPRLLVLVFDIDFCLITVLNLILWEVRFKKFLHPMKRIFAIVKKIHIRAANFESLKLTQFS